MRIEAEEWFEFSGEGSVFSGKVAFDSGINLHLLVELFLAVYLNAILDCVLEILGLGSR